MTATVAARGGCTAFAVNGADVGALDGACFEAGARHTPQPMMAAARVNTEPVRIPEVGDLIDESRWHGHDAAGSE